MSAIDVAREVTDCPYPENCKSPSIGPCPLHRRIAAAIEQAEARGRNNYHKCHDNDEKLLIVRCIDCWEEGRDAGLEEVLKLHDDHPGCCFPHNQIRAMKRGGREEAGDEATKRALLKRRP